MAEAPDTVTVAHDALELVVGPQRIAARGDEGQHALPHLLVDPGIGEAGADFGQQCLLLERGRAGAGHDMLRQHVEAAGAEVLSVALAFVHGFLGRGRLEKLEAVAGDQQGAAGLVEPVVGTPDALEQARGTLGSAHLDDQVDITPVHAEIEAGGRDKCAQFAPRHRPFDLAPRLARKRAVVDADGQLVLVHVPQVLEDVFGKKTRVGKYQRGPVPADLFVKLRDRPCRRMPAPWHALFIGQQDFDFRRRAFLAFHQPHRIQIAPGGQPFAEGFRTGDSGRQGHALHTGRDGLQPRHCQRQQVAPLAGGEGVDLVDHDPL